MPQIPNCEHAFVDDLKLIDYCLSEKHPRGKHKARVFKSALGLIAEDYLILKHKLQTHVSDGAKLGELDEYGQRYEIDFEMTHGDNVATVRSAWMTRTDEDYPRLLSCYVI